MADQDKVFSGSIPKLYDSHLVPLIFQPYAADLAKRLAKRAPTRVLETAAGTGVVTRALAAALPEQSTIVATDLNQAMVDQAAAIGTKRPVEWRTADAMSLPFPDQSFDAVVCQFGAMFFPDKPRAFAEARRVLRPGGAFLFNVWDRIEENQFADAVTRSLGTMFPEDPPRFLARTPHGYHDVLELRKHVAAAGFSASPRIQTLEERSRAPNAEWPAIAYCQGTPLRAEIETRGPGRLAEATRRAALAVAQRFGTGIVEGKIQAHVVEVER